MATNIFHEPSRKLPESDPRIEKIDFKKNDIGARMSHLPTAGEIKNDKTITHIKS